MELPQVQERADRLTVARHYLAVAAVFAVEYCELPPARTEQIRRTLEAALELAVAQELGAPPPGPS